MATVIYIAPAKKLGQKTNIFRLIFFGGDGAGSLSALGSRQEKLDGMLTELRDLERMLKDDKVLVVGLWMKDVTL